MAQEVVDQVGRVGVSLAKGDVIQAGTGTPYRNVYIFKFIFRDGLITHIAEYANPVTFAKLAGMPLG